MTTGSSAASERFIDLVIAILAVNGWHLDKVGELIESLKKNGFHQPSEVINRDLDINKRYLESSGYARGDYMVTMLAGRLLEAANYFVINSLEEKLREAEMKKDTVAIGVLIKPIKGVGKMVIENFLILRGML